MGMMDDPEELPLISSSPELVTAPEKPKAQDELDLPTLKRVLILMDAQIASYASIDRLTVEEKDLTVQQQLAVNKAVIAHLNEVRTLVETTITEVKEQYE